MSRFDGMNVIVTGAGSGIGKATTEAFCAERARVAGLDIEPSGVPKDALAIEADVARAESIERGVAEAVASLGSLDVLVNNAGIGAVGTVSDNDDDEWRRVFEVNVFGIVRTTRAAMPALRNSRRASIVNVASIVATAGLPMRACYSASKGAVLSLTLAMAADHVREGVRVNCVCPGTADTPWVGRLLDQADDPAAERAALEARQPMGRLATAQEVADAILFLAAPSSSFVTGVALPVDGGMQGLRLRPR
jgi:NAD(P)-dependent dehydrogenase (short-subunit alcohol dehydrogenase family)